MQLALNQLSSHLAKGLRSLYVLHGDDPLQQQEAADAIRAAARAQGYTERSSYTVAGAHFDYQNAYPPRVQPGDQILVHAGVYLSDRHHYMNRGPAPGYLALATVFDGTYYLTQSGTPEKPIINASVTPQTVDEGGSVTFRFTADPAPLADTTVNLQITGTATGARISRQGDYDNTVLSKGFVIIPAGQTSTDITVPVFTVYL